jgi:uncharacterized membrane protein YecN with MAPEG domain
MFRSTRFKYLLTVAAVRRAQQSAKLVAGFMCIDDDAGPLIHSTAIPAGDLPKRILGMQLTFAAVVTAAITNLVPFIFGLI